MALTKVAMPSGKLCMAMAITEKSPSRMSPVLSGTAPSSEGAAEYSWGLSFEGIRLSMRAISAIPAKKARTVYSSPVLSPKAEPRLARASAKSSVMEMKSITPAEKPRANERVFVLNFLVSSTITPPSPVDSPAMRVRSSAMGKLLSLSIVISLRRRQFSYMPRSCRQSAGYILRGQPIPRGWRTATEY